MTYKFAEIWNQWLQILPKYLICTVPEMQWKNLESWKKWHFLKKINPILGTRYREGIDFGFVYMDIMHVYPEDAGSYTLKATNALGQAVNSADLHVKSNEVIVKETMHAAAVEQISHMEQQSQISQVSTLQA